MKERLLERENSLSKYACKSVDGYRLKEEKEDVRPVFFRDTDRIIHSLSYTRYADKTQVFSFSKNDHISKRIVHVTLVSKIARTIGRLLNLNEDLIEAIALGHDNGHCPIGHVGERMLNEIAKRELNETFMHNIQSVRNYMFIEKNGKGLNLTVQVLDGIMCHNGEILERKYYPREKTKEEFLEEYNSALKDNSVSKSMVPMTLEGCVVRISDIIAYIGRDIEDAINLKIIDRESIPKEIRDVVGSKNKDIVNNMILDIVENSIDKDYISMSEKMFKTIFKLKEFNYTNIYEKANDEKTEKYYENAFNTLYKRFINDIDNKNTSSSIFYDFIDNMSKEYLKNTKKERMVIDFIAGMTDDYFIREYQKSI